MMYYEEEEEEVFKLISFSSVNVNVNDTSHVRFDVIVFLLSSPSSYFSIITYKLKRPIHSLRKIYVWYGKVSM